MVVQSIIAAHLWYTQTWLKLSQTLYALSFISLHFQFSSRFGWERVKFRIWLGKGPKPRSMYVMGKLDTIILLIKKWRSIFLVFWARSDVLFLTYKCAWKRQRMLAPQSCDVFLVFLPLIVFCRHSILIQEQLLTSVSIALWQNGCLLVSSCRHKCCLFYVASMKSQGLGC
jgi:hypothetical protein